jgi:hypothetical protein
MKLAAKYNNTVFIVQHCMVNQEQYGPRYLLLGGEKLKYLCDSIVYLETVNAKDSRLTDGDEVAAREDLIIGKKIRARADKTRNTVEGKSVEFWMNFEECHFALANESLFTLATKLGVIYTQTEIITDPKGRPELDKDGNTKTKEKKGWLEVMVDDTPFSCYGQPKMVEKLKDPAFAAKVRAMCNDSKKMSATSGKFSEVKDT